MRTGRKAAKTKQKTEERTPPGKVDALDHGLPFLRDVDANVVKDHRTALWPVWRAVNVDLERILKVTHLARTILELLLATLQITLTALNLGPTCLEILLLLGALSFFASKGQMKAQKETNVRRSDHTRWHPMSRRPRKGEYTRTQKVPGKKNGIHPRPRRGTD